MGLQYGGVTPNKIYYNNAEVKSVYYNNVKVWGYKLFEGTLAVGNTVIFDNKSWIVVHRKVDSGHGTNIIYSWVLALSTTYGDPVQFHNIDENISWTKSYMYNNIIPNFINTMSATAISLLFEVIGNKIFLPSCGNLRFFSSSDNDISSGYFDYYSSNAKRICNDQNGNPIWWWTREITSTGTSGSIQKNVYSVTDNGKQNSLTGILTYHGFRPHIHIKTNVNGDFIVAD